MNLDWLQLFGTLGKKYSEQTLISPGGFIIDRAPIGSRQFKDVYMVITSDGEVAARLECNPNLKVLGKQDAMLQIANRWLYSSSLPYLLEDVCSSLDFAPKHITRLDVALDGCNQLPIVLTDYLRQHKGSTRIIKMGAARTNAYCYDHTNHYFTRYSIGSARSDKHVSVYCKSDELKNSRKQYIAECWRANGINPAERVYRCEARLRSKYLQSIAGFKIDYIFDDTYLQNLYYTAVHTAVDFRVNSYSHKEQNARIQAIDWSNISCQKLNRTYNVNQTDDYKTKMASHLMSKHILMELHNDADLAILKRAEDILLNKANLNEWHEKKLQEWSVKYVSLKKVMEEIFKS